MKNIICNALFLRELLLSNNRSKNNKPEYIKPKNNMPKNTRLKNKNPENNNSKASESDDFEIVDGLAMPGGPGIPAGPAMSAGLTVSSGPAISVGSVVSGGFSVPRNFVIPEDISTSAEFVMPVDFKALVASSSTSDNPYLSGTLVSAILSYISDTGAFSQHHNKYCVYPLYLSIPPSLTPETVFMHDFLRCAIEVEGSNYLQICEWVDLGSGSFVPSTPKDYLIDEFVARGFFHSDIIAILSSYQQILLYTNRYLLEAMFKDLFLTSYDMDSLPEDKWHIKSTGLTCRLNLFKKAGLVFAQMRFADITLSHMRWGDYVIPGEIKTFFYLDKSNIKAPT